MTKSVATIVAMEMIVNGDDIYSAGFVSLNFLGEWTCRTKFKSQKSNKQKQALANAYLHYVCPK